MTDFVHSFFRKLTSSLANNHSDNHDTERFGVLRQGKGIKQIIRERVERGYISKGIANNSFWVLKEFTEQKEKFDFLFAILGDKESKELMVDIWAYKVLGKKYVKLPVNTPYYWETLKKIKEIKEEEDSIDPHFLHFKLNRYDLRKLGKDLSIYFYPQGILVDFFLEQYQYKTPDIQIGASPGDVIIDAGGCWGDTALYFGGKSGIEGRVYSFEFIPGNIDIFKRNMSLNPALANHIQLVENPLWNKSGQKIYFTDNGPGSKVAIEEFEGAQGYKETITIDDFVEQNNINKVDFIKMDIEGAEPMALEGAIRTIRKFKPNLAIAIYHSTSDFLNIPHWISQLNLGYKLYMGHYTIHAEETILFCTID